MTTSGSNNFGAIDADEAARRASAALAQGDPIGALQWVSLATEPVALALTASALARLQDWDGAKRALRQAARGFAATKPIEQARCAIALAEVELLSRELGDDETGIRSAIDRLEAHGDRHNALYGRLVLGRSRVLLGRSEEALTALAPLMIPGVAAELPPPLRTLLHLIRAEAAVRRIEANRAAEELSHAARAAEVAKDPALIAEVAGLRAELTHPAARLLHLDTEQVCTLSDVESLFASHPTVIDGCRRRLRHASGDVELSSRPVLFQLLETLAQGGEAGATRLALIQTAFEFDDVNEELRARLRVEIGRLRAAVTPLLDIVATEAGYVLQSPGGGPPPPRLLPPMPGTGAALSALLSDGAAWSTGALAAALARSRRTVQRELQSLSDVGDIIALGQGPARRWRAAPTPAIATALLLPLHPMKR